ncbi:MAG TPA: RbsD/FucU domain-containing protein [Spirochaetia bacterium]|nr:RbsD/FucU domain-containing protein [Spirochaetia bacterium]
MLKGIPPLVSPDLMHVLLSMGHGDEIVIADGNFPAESVGKRVVRMPGLTVKDILDVVLQFFPLDTYVDFPVGLMAVVPGDPAKPANWERPEVWDTYREIILRHEPAFKEFDFIERFAFYERAREAFAVVSTSDKALYANIILKKGTV